MLASTLLVKKRDGLRLSDDEIRFLVDGFCRGEVADYQMSAFAMAVCLQGMNFEETATLTRAMLESGDVLRRQDHSAAHHNVQQRVDKHSTGGLGDKVSLVLAPLLAACGFQVPMISGRGLGLTGGTLDKLESIPGYRTELSETESTRIVQEVGAFIIGASERIAPADQKLYALRDVTGTVESIPLITASILSKKLAASLDALVMDVKVGSAAFMKTHSAARNLAESIVQVGQQAGLPTRALLTDMDQPLGWAVGNAIEVNEAVAVLKGERGPTRDLTLQLAAELIQQTEPNVSIADAIDRLVLRIDEGSAMERFERMIAAQGGTLPSSLPLHATHPMMATSDGFVAGFDCEAIGRTIVSLGGGRRKMGDPIDHRVGIEVHVRVGDSVRRDEPLFTLYCRDSDADDALASLKGSVRLSDQPVEPRELVIERVEA